MDIKKNCQVGRNIGDFRGPQGLSQGPLPILVNFEVFKVLQGPLPHFQGFRVFRGPVDTLALILQRKLPILMWLWLIVS